MSGYSNTFVNLTLGWLKGLANWVLKLFNLAGSGASPLEWFSDHAVKLLIVLMIVGVAVDVLVWMVRWRPYWVWFGKRRILVNDERILTEDFYESAEDDDLFSREYVVPSAKRPKSASKHRSPQQRAARSKPMRAAYQRSSRKTPARDIFSDEMFEVSRDAEVYPDPYEDEVFDVSNLPGGQEHRNRRKRK